MGQSRYGLEANRTVALRNLLRAVEGAEVSVNFSRVAVNTSL